MEKENYIQEEHYLNAKKRIKEIKAFYVHLIVNLVSIPIIVAVNLVFSPGFHWFWFAVVGIALATFFHWLGVFGLNNKRIRQWEDKKIKELMNEQSNFKSN
ncbi:2TM domain-containing protein [Pseudotenacibaculum sp. MALMAid0570]|uniref:2TM domain-containing protein n=1 Tax=Pseudotenacibaculum sp. MALMAid0570 TaxID=3143938 RepID=UPI0032E03322